ncbi:MAG TPA: bifunctional phosphopantothenoylcysteine decarboxylase/phosphopantothenate--cysteine ligase CoaBC [Syntrophomonadaceae bacterium]|nr:bifunctional phosphopantothenoylcysteine decarboxylase/phosphopantothenate--cysteine ligase CoaBC [Syntrophomonadaceae bacterium]
MKKSIVLGITGSIAAYKAAELTSMLVKKGYEVYVIMTQAATKFVTPLTLQTLSQHPVYVEMFDSPQSWEIGHISLAQRADVVLVAPATANFIAKLAAGLADDLLSATLLATRAPVIIAPAMNVGMYENPIFQKSMQFLKEQGYFFVEPDEGRLACGTTGKGRLAELDKIVSALEEIFSAKHELSGKHVLVTAGPTREPIDPVRFLSNYSSGKMGYAIAQEARERGARVTLVSGPCHLEPPAGVDLIPVETAQEMFDAVIKHFDTADVVIKAAAVADFRPRQRAAEKIKKDEAVMTLELERTPDILQHLGDNKRDQVLVGFAAETENIVENARAKLKRKNLDLLVANDLTEEGAGFGVDTNVATLFFPDGTTVKLPKMTKRELARAIIDQVIKLLTTKKRMV